ncbi:DUF4834 family protein [Aurantibacter sp.]|uniref:DUF4834 family protein n=1 Tax=Aurantibacter sp. TaxID=2807103 RepID=UPI0035C830C6
MLQEASLTGLFKVLLYIALFYYGFKILSRIFAPLLLKYVMKKAETKFGAGFKSNQQTKSKKEGEITIENIPDKKSTNNKVGEYVDYEEVE